MGDLVIERETTLCELPRGKDGKEVLRVQLAEARTERGPVTWHSLRVFWRDDATGQWRPGKQGITIRARELDNVLAALQGKQAAQDGSSRQDSDDAPF